MEIIYMLLAISVVVALVFFVAFVVTVKRGQYDDVYTPSVRMLFDDELVKTTSKTTVNQTKNQSKPSLNN
jgi:cbb3-type cytochrome oxidase maturation protein